MDKKKLWILLFAVFPLLVGLACTCGLLPIGGNKEAEPLEEIVEVPPEVLVEEVPIEEVVEEVVEEVLEPDEPVEEIIESDEDLIMYKDRWLQEDKNVFVAFLLKNQNDDLNLKDVAYSITLLDKDGEEIKKDWGTFSWLFAEQTVGVTYDVYLSDDSAPVDSVDIQFEFETTVEANGFLNPFSSEKVKIWEGGARPAVTGIIRNDHTDTYTMIRTNVICYDTNGEIVGGNNQYYLEFVPGEGYMGFNTLINLYGEVDSIEVFPVITPSTVIYEASEDLWDRISILDEHFYTTQSGAMNGGVVIQSNLDDAVLKRNKLVVVFYDQDGFVTTHATHDVNYLMPGSILGVRPSNIFTPPRGSETKDYEVFILPGEMDQAYEIQEDVFRVNSVVLTGDNNKYAKVNFTNIFTKPVSEVDVYVLVYNPEGKIIGGGKAATEERTPSWGTTETELVVYYSPDQEVGDVQAWVVPSIWTKFE